MLVAHLATCAFMTGVIWIIQILHYPAFRDIEASKFCRFHRGHSRRISFIVAPMMLAEFLTGALLIFRNPREILLVSNIALLVGTWFCTFAVSVPIHNSLEKVRDSEKIEKLIRTNWPRTLLWTARTAILVFYAIEMRS